MASPELDRAIASKNWTRLLAAVEADEDPAAAVQRAAPAMAHWDDERRELSTELWRELADGGEPPPWLPLTRSLRLEQGDDLAGIERTPWLTALDLVDYIGPLAGLAHVPGLRKLATTLVDPGAMAKLTRLESLTVQQPDGMSSLSSLPLGPSLRVLVIGHSELTSLDGLERAPALQRLELVDNRRLSDVSGVAALHDLQFLSLTDSAEITDLSPLAGLSRLEQLELLGADGVATLPDLGPLTALRELALGGEQLQSLAPLAGLTALAKLQLEGLSSIEDLAPLGALGSLRRLALRSMPRVADVAPLAGLTRLESLQLGDLDAVADIAPLRGLRGLQALTLRGLRALRSLEPIADLGALENLLITDCPGVVDIAPVAAATSIRYITLRGLALRDVSALAVLPRLEQIGVSQTPPPAGLDAFDAARTRVYDPNRL